jgi:hypothetical protein
VVGSVLQVSVLAYNHRTPCKLFTNSSAVGADNALSKFNQDMGWRADKSAVGTMNRPLRGFAAMGSISWLIC